MEEEHERLKKKERKKRVAQRGCDTAVIFNIVN